MRRANICYAQGLRFQACKHLTQAAVASPSYFTNRVLYEVREKAAAVNGEDPSLFLKKQDVLWPETIRVNTASEPAVTF